MLLATQVEVTWVEVVVAKEQVKATSWVVVVVTWVEVAFHVASGCERRKQKERAKPSLGGKMERCEE